MKFKELKKINLNRLEISDKNIRKQNVQREKNILKLSIRKKGILDPLVVVYDEDNQKYRIIKGQRRFFASKELRDEGFAIYELPCVVKEETPVEEIEESLTDELMRASVVSKDVGEAIIDLINHYGSIEKVAEETGMDAIRLSYYIPFTTLNPPAPPYSYQKARESTVSEEKVETPEGMTIEESREFERRLHDPTVPEQQKDPTILTTIVKEYMKHSGENVVRIPIEESKLVSDMAKEQRVVYRRLLDQLLIWSVRYWSKKPTKELTDMRKNLK